MCIAQLPPADSPYWYEDWHSRTARRPPLLGSTSRDSSQRSWPNSSLDQATVYHLRDFYNAGLSCLCNSLIFRDKDFHLSRHDRTRIAVLLDDLTNKGLLTRETHEAEGVGWGHSGGGNDHVTAWKRIDSGLTVVGCDYTESHINSVVFISVLPCRGY